MRRGGISSPRLRFRYLVAYFRLIIVVIFYWSAHRVERETCDFSRAGKLEFARGGENIDSYRSGKRDVDSENRLFFTRLGVLSGSVISRARSPGLQ